jgi:hypothetical protein
MIVIGVRQHTAVVCHGREPHHNSVQQPQHSQVAPPATAARLLQDRRASAGEHACGDEQRDSGAGEGSETTGDRAAGRWALSTVDGGVQVTGGWTGMLTWVLRLGVRW